MNSSRSGSGNGSFISFKRTALVYGAVALGCLVITNVYALFGHGVRSAAMDFMFLYPAVGGALVFALLQLAFPCNIRRRYFRPGYNLYNSGIAALTAGAMLRGIVEIAGTDSGLIGIFFLLGWLLVAAGVAVAALP